MNKKMGIIGVIILFITSFGAYAYMNQPVATIEENAAAVEISTTYNIPVTIKDLGTDSNGYTVMGQTVYNTVTGQVVAVYLDDSVDPTSYQAYAILYHEEGHIVHILDGTTNTELTADQYAASRGYNITDAYEGVH